MARIAYSTATPTTPRNDRDGAARMMAAARRQREAQAAEARREAKAVRMAEAYVGHATTVESDDDYGRFWMSFDATPEGALEAARYIIRLSDAGELSDIDCTMDCFCTKERYPFMFDA